MSTQGGPDIGDENAWWAMAKGVYDGELTPSPSISDRWTAQQLAEMDETAWRELSNDDGPPDICHCGDSGCIRTFEHAIALRAENELLKSQLALANDTSESLLRTLGDLITERNELASKLPGATPPAEPPSGPSWLDRVAAGPQRIGRPLP